MLTDTLASVALAVDPVPWARSQMAFTLAFHIILVPLGVSWAVMTLIANYRGIRHDDQDALLLAQRWSKYMAVTFAVGAVTGTVLSLRVRPAVAQVHGPVGRGVRGPVRVRGHLLLHRGGLHLHLHLRLAPAKPWAHFWTGVPIAVAGIFGSISVVAANAWMNSPQGVTLDSSGKVTDVDPMGVIFNDAMPLMAAHMVIAAYLVGGFLIASVYAVGMLRGRTRPLPPARLHHRVHRRGDRDPGPDGRRRLARPLGLQQPAHQVRRDRDGAADRAATCPRSLLGHLNSDGQVVGGHPDPRPGLVAVGPEHRQDHRRPGPRQRAGRRAADHPRRSTSSTSPGTSWSASARCCSCSRCGTGRRWIFRRDMPRSKWFLRIAAGRRRRSPWSRMEAGWVVSEVGRQPWIVYNQMKVEDAATANTGVWITFIARHAALRRARRHARSWCCAG